MSDELTVEEMQKRLEEMKQSRKPTLVDLTEAVSRLDRAAAVLRKVIYEIRPLLLEKPKP